MNVKELCYADMLQHSDGWYIVRRIWQTTIWSSDERQPPTYRLEGFELIESKSGTLRQVRAEELQTFLDEGTLQFYHPITVRRVAGFR